MITKLELKNKFIIKRKTKKSQILLYDTHRKINDFLVKIKNRDFTSKNTIPHFIVCKNGSILNLFDMDHYSLMFEKDIDKRQIKIAFENLGWLKKNIMGQSLNWIGDKTLVKPFFKRWREQNNWDPYTEEQMNSFFFLLDYLCEKHGIENNLKDDYEKINNIKKYKGILLKSDVSDIYTDINPSFFKLKNEKFKQNNW